MECDIYIRDHVDGLKRECAELRKRLEETVRENARLEEELCRLRRAS